MGGSAHACTRAVPHVCKPGVHVITWSPKKRLNHMNENLNENTAPTTYIFGDKAAYTGNVMEIYGGTFYEVTMLEGHLKGQLKAVKQPPVATVEVKS